MHAFDRRLNIRVGASGDGEFVQLFVALAIEHAHQPVLAADGDQITRLAAYRRPEQWAYLRQIAVVLVRGSKLVEPEELAGAHIECDDGVRVQVVAGRAAR